MELRLRSRPEWLPGTGGFSPMNSVTWSQGSPGAESLGWRQEARLSGGVAGGAREVRPVNVPALRDVVRGYAGIATD